MIRGAEDALRDRTYQRTPVGREVGRYLRLLKFAGGSDHTESAYETVLSRLAVDHDDFPSLEAFAGPVGTDYLRAFLERHWADASVSTRGQRTRIVKGFFRWAYEEGRISADPARTLRTPRGRGGARQAYNDQLIDQLVSGQDSLRDQCALQLFGILALRKNDVRLLRVRDIDLARNLLVLRHGKGGKQAVLPLEPRPLREDLYLHVVGEGREPAEFLLYPKKDKLRPMDPASMHRWFKRCLERAGLPQTVLLHELRHTALDRFHRATGDIVLTARLARHESIGTTQGYLHPSQDDLAAALRRLG